MTASSSNKFLFVDSIPHGDVNTARIAREKALPFEPLVPNAETIEAIKEARRGNLPSFANVDEVMADLNEDD